MNVDHDRAESLAQRINRHFPGRAFASRDVAPALKTADGLIHATPTGMADHPGLPIAADSIHHRFWVCDVVWNGGRHADSVKVDREVVI